jgi:NADPH:quinone reductase-like Zn-dependent oxidoreductase
MGFEGFGHDVILGTNTYTRPANMTLYNQGNAWVAEMQTNLDNGNIKPHPVKEIFGSWAGILEGLKMLQHGEVRGEKLVVVVASE